MKYFFIGIAGAGMSAIAQYLVGKGHTVAGSDRIFLKPEGNDSRQKLTAEGIACYAQGEASIDEDTDYVVVSTAIEDTVPEYAFARARGIKTIHRSDLLAEICAQNRTIAVAGTSGKSTTTAMIYHILQQCGLSPSLITGAGLVSIQEQGKIGNAAVGTSDILVIETDESDGTIVKYHPSIGIILNIDRDHKPIEELMPLFATFADHTQKTLIVNLDNERSAKFSKSKDFDFSCKVKCTNFAEDFTQTMSGISFKSNGTLFKISSIGRHNMENAMAAISVARLLGINDSDIALALANYSGIYRRNRIIGSSNGITIMDDFAHNPAKISATLSACQAVAERVIAWFQPHGFAPSRLMKDELIQKLSALLRPQDVMIFSQIYYAGGTADKSISAQEFADGISTSGKTAIYIPLRNDIISYIKSHTQHGDMILLMGARDPSLGDFAEDVKNAILS
ncbi:MAG: UDP-N-acetylmuramate--alanine ligase [Bacteroidales bacterium]|nr:UDP-N-acetylmuramate--alanine ligase [Bacteroidales bacterium]